MAPVSGASDAQLDTQTSHVLSTWILTPSRHTTSSYFQHGYIDLDDLEDYHQLDMVVRQSGRDENLERVTSSKGLVLAVCIVMASLLLLAVVVLAIVCRYGRAFPAAGSVDRLPAGCRSCLVACGLRPAGVTRVATEDTSRPPPNATPTAAADDCGAAFPSKTHRPSGGTVVVASTQMKHSRVQSAANSQGVIEWYV